MLVRSAAIAAAGTAAPAQDGYAVEDPLPGYTHSLTVRWCLTVVNRTDAVCRRPELKCLVPVRLTSTQLCRSVRASEPAELLTDGWGNQALICRLADLPPYGRARVAFCAQVDTSPAPLLTADASTSAAFLQPSPGVESPVPEIAAAASAALSPAGGGSPVDVLSAWVARSLRHDGYHAVDRGAAWALAHRRGDCSEFAALLVALCRVRDIPARRMLGVALPAAGGTLAAGTLHVWVETREDDRWRPVDPLRQLDAAHRPVAFGILTRDAIAVTAFDSKLFRCEGKGVEVRLDGGSGQAAASAGRRL